MENKNKKNWGEITLITAATAVIVALGVYLFFGESIKYGLDIGANGNSHAIARSDNDVLTIGYVFEVKDLDPVLYDPVSRGWMGNIYEPLVATDENLNIKPALASKWGMIDPYTWEFVVRDNVKFHDGRNLEPGDVAASLERALKDEKSQLKSLLGTIDKVEIGENMRIRVRTKVPDPLLLAKIATVYITPAGYTDFSRPVGTGPYFSEGFIRTEMDLSRFDAYWGQLPSFNKVVLKVIPGREDRIKALENKEVDFLMNFPPNYGCAFFEEYKKIKGCKTLNSQDISVRAMPGLEVSFIAFNFEHGLFSKKDFRIAVQKALDPEVFKTIAFGFAVPARQFVSSGVFGFNPGIKPPEYDLEIARKIIDKVIGGSFERISVTFDYPDSLPPVGQYVQVQFKDLGIDVDLNPLTDAELSKKISSGKSDMYYMGWRSELGDASDFLLAAVHSSDKNTGFGLFNGMNYSNEKVDALLEEAQKNMDTQARLEQLQEVMKIITEEDIVGVPLFESEVLYAYDKDLRFTPRVDGYVYAANIK